ncbi:MAG: hypothetical protein U1E62_01450 [Alsobacter sp.]
MESEAAPAALADLLYGAEAIAAFLGTPVSYVYSRHVRKRLRLRRFGGRLLGNRSVILQALAELPLSADDEPAIAAKPAAPKRRGRPPGSKNRLRPVPAEGDGR